MKRFALLIFIAVASTSSFCFAQVKEKKVVSFNAATRPKNLSDSALLDLVQKQTFRYFWDFAHPVSGLSRERSNMGNVYGLETTTVGGTGFGIMTLLVAVERGWITRDTAVGHLLKILRFLRKADKYHGAFPHWLNGETGKIVPFSPKDDGADVVETSYLFQGLLCARQYFNQDNQKEKQLRNFINWLWNDVEWDWFTRDGISVLYWHWSPNHGWSMNNEIRGWNECLITYILAGSSTNYSIKTNVYGQGWTNGFDFKNQGEFYKIKLPLGPDYGGPLFFSQYSFLGLDPRGLKDRYADYWEQNKNHTLINRAYCIDNPKEFKGYGENSWGLTASDTWSGYDAHSPTNDNGTITPTAALSAFPYTPEYSMQALKHFYNNLGDKIWSEYGFVDAFNETKNWYAGSHLAIDQGPIIVMIENYRSGLLWKLFMSCPEIQKGLKKLGFQSPHIK
ncbi:MAG: glucoamylase family protein [Chitinophagaceae bacterium]